MSALGTAVGVLLLHTLSRSLRLDRKDAWLATAFTTCCPGWTVFATVVEVHGPFLPFAAGAFLTISALVRRGGSVRAVLTGLVIGLAYLAHPTGALLIARAPLFAAIAERRGIRGDFHLVQHGLLVALGLAIGILVVSNTLVALGQGTGPGPTLNILLGNPWSLVDLDFWASNLWIEVIAPYSPIAILGGIASAHRSTRQVGPWLAAAVLPYLLVSQMLFDSGGDRGASLLPLAWPTACCVLPLVRTRLWLALALFACHVGLGTTRIKIHADPEPARTYAEGFRAIGGPKPILVLGQ